jgi:hypothetical protein
MEYYYYRVDGGAALEAVNRFREKHKAAMEELNAFGSRFGADGYYGSERSITGLRIPTGCPDGWKQVTYGYYAPMAKSKEGKALRAEMRKLCIPGADAFMSEFGMHSLDFMDGLTLYSMGFKNVGPHTIITVPKCGTTWTPPDEFCVPLKDSEYWSLVESQKPE